MLLTLVPVPATEATEALEGVVSLLSHEVFGTFVRRFVFSAARVEERVTLLMAEIRERGLNRREARECIEAYDGAAVEQLRFVQSGAEGYAAHGGDQGERAQQTVSAPSPASLAPLTTGVPFADRATEPPIEKTDHALRAVVLTTADKCIIYALAEQDHGARRRTNSYWPASQSDLLPPADDDNPIDTDSISANTALPYDCLVEYKDPGANYDIHMDDYPAKQALVAFGLTLAHFDRCMHLFDVFNGGTNGLHRYCSDAVSSISDPTPSPSSIVSQWACGLDYLIQGHQFHNAGNDARFTVLDMIQILLLFVGGSSPGVLGTKDCPMYVTIDFEGGAVKDARSVHNRTKVTTETVTPCVVHSTAPQRDLPSAAGPTAFWQLPPLLHDNITGGQEQQVFARPEEVYHLYGFRDNWKPWRHLAMSALRIPPDEVSSNQAVSEKRDERSTKLE
ncbi:hypothetical protein D6C93_01768 [Aureobasidium pullulans]|nr:hypothetical protein D6C93_01768 [Aureobasidium pullulans]